MASDDSSEHSSDSDAPFHPEKEPDQGEASDREADALDAWMERFELEADRNALLGIEVTGDGQPPPSGSGQTTTYYGAQGSGKKSSGNPKATRKSKRGPTMNLHNTGDMVLEFDDLGRPTGPWRAKYGVWIGLSIRKLNINWSWRHISPTLLDVMWTDTMNMFHLPDEVRYKKLYLSALNVRWRDFKSKLVSGWITMTRVRSKKEKLGDSPPDVYKHIKKEDWATFKEKMMSDHAIVSLYSYY
ncbi:uncharacterized protein LOC125492836 [Beta vulgaris subsp. vulgaris]|uniref:uncharacterized protein LOC125492836 n=1 Tax=Beta vulgaris subsp. vulgaris TaxID=3555 RepID=UPI0025472B2A|nr:uncharacterized protein LOC125492836 [Beta vulgaris subsp. vulgaris]